MQDAVRMTHFWCQNRRVVHEGPQGRQINSSVGTQPWSIAYVKDDLNVHDKHNWGNLVPQIYTQLEVYLSSTERRVREA